MLQISWLALFGLSSRLIFPFVAKAGSLDHFGQSEVHKYKLHNEIYLQPAGCDQLTMA